jgi:large subunit ribosomal protein L9
MDSGRLYADMKVVLRQDVPKLGEAGTVQVVKDGYARNFLIPQGMAVVATAGEVKTAEHNQAVKDRKVARQEVQLQALADRIDGLRLEFTERAGEQGRLYGSVTAGDIAEKLAAAVGEEIDRRKVVLEEQLRTVGEHTVAVHLVGRLRPTVTVVVVGVDEAGNPIQTQPTAAAADANADASADTDDATPAAVAASDEAAAADDADADADADAEA